MYPFWQHQLLAAILIAFIPSIIVSFILMRFANLEKYKESAFGRYIRQFMTRAMEVIRATGYVMMAAGTWYHIVRLIPFGLLIVALAWLRGVIFPKKIPPQTDGITEICPTRIRNLLFSQIRKINHSFNPRQNCQWWFMS
jgi:hypothetical protein